MKKGVWVVFCLGLLCGCGHSEVATVGLVPCYGELRNVYEDFRITADFDRGAYPVSFEQDGHYGFKDATGEVLVTAIYEAVRDFENGVGQVGADLGGKIIWKYVDVHGQISAYNRMDGFEYGLSMVRKNGLYGMINTQGDQVIPLLYEVIGQPFRYEDKDGAYLAAYAQREGEWVLLNLTAGYESRYEPYDAKRSEDYARVLNLAEADVLVVNGMALVAGESEHLGSGLPLCVLDGVAFDLYGEDGALGRELGHLGIGANGRDLVVNFPLVADDAPYFALVAGSTTPLVAWERVADGEIAKTVAQDYLRGQNVENTPLAVSESWQGDLLGQGVQGAIFELHDGYSDQVVPLPLAEQWDRARFLVERAAFVATVVVVDDLAQPENYRVVAQTICQSTGPEHQHGEEVCFVVDLDHDGIWELILGQTYGRWQGYRVMELNKAA